MKTTRIFIGLFSVLAVANLFLSEWLIFGYAAIALIFSILLLHEEKKNAQFTFKINDAEEKLSEVEDELNHSIRTVKLQFQDYKDLNLKIIALQTELETAQANSYTEVERKRGREKYNRLYKREKKVKAVTAQKIEQNKIEPFRMVVNPKQSAIVQQILFDNGYQWRSGAKKVLYTNSKELFLENVITICDNIINLDEDRKNLPKLSFRKFMSMYGKKKEPYTIEGKTIKQLVEENLGIMIKTNLDHNYFLCGYEPSTTEKDIDPIMASDKKQIKIIKSDIFPNDPNTIFSWCSYEQLILAIKRHRNIK